ncbi:hypothetical protein [Maridesulfovibrio sp. FT414]|uniref:hypothetical protein n=1 Tax=Maridesulfovibrio sp. FT414 TaxID=2979469 RepID=UPI003D808583
MKGLMKFVLAMAMVLMMSGGAMAQSSFYPQGSALMSNLIIYYASPVSWTLPYITLTNITDSNVRCKVNIYDSEGSSITHLSRVVKGGANWVQIALGTSDFDIPAHSSRMFYLTTNSVFHTIGYAEIEWQSDDPKARKALIGGVMQHRCDGSSYTNTTDLINNGQPF